MMNDRKMRMAAQLLQFMDQMDGDELKNGMVPPPNDKPGMDAEPAKGMPVEVAQVDPEKAKQMLGGMEAMGGSQGLSNGVKNLFGGGEEPVPPSGQNGDKKGPMEKLMEGKSAMNDDEPNDDELEELAKMNA